MRRSILYAITRAELGGAQTHVRDLVTHFARDFDVHVACGEIGWLTEVSRAAGARIHHIPSLVRQISTSADLRAYKEIKRLIASLNPDLVHAHSSKAGFITRIALNGTRIPTVFTAHGWSFSKGAPVLQRALGVLAEHLVAGKSHVVIAVSQADEMLARRFGLHHRCSLVTIRNGVQDCPERASPIGEASEVRLISVARFVVQKDHETLLHALSKMRGAWHLDLVGSGPEEGRIRTLADSLNVSDRINFLGDRTDVPQLLARAHIFVLATRQEGLPLTVLEAMRAGLPVVASATGGIPETLKHGESGFLVGVRQAHEMRSYLERLVFDGALRSKMGASGRRLYEESFTTHRMLGEVQALYTNCLGLVRHSTAA